MPAVIRQLEIGPGPQRLGRDWQTLDWAPGPIADYAARWGEEPLPLPDNYFSLVYASHVLEHVPWFKTHEALCEVHRILKPGGVFEVWVPDFGYLVKCYREGVCGDEWRKHNPHGDPFTWLAGRLFTYGPEPNWHRAIFDARHLESCLTRAGFTHISELESPRGHDHGPINLGRCAIKAS